MIMTIALHEISLLICRIETRNYRQSYRDCLLQPDDHTYRHIFMLYMFNVFAYIPFLYTYAPSLSQCPGFFNISI